MLAIDPFYFVYLKSMKKSNPIVQCYPYRLQDFSGFVVYLRWGNIILETHTCESVCGCKVAAHVAENGPLPEQDLLDGQLRGEASY